MKKKYVKDYVADETVEGGYRYTGIYYLDAIKDEKRKTTGITHLLIGLFQIALVLIAASINCLGNRTIYVVIPMECTLFCALNLCLGAYTFLRSSNRMHLKDYEGSYQRMVQSVAVAFFLNVASCIGQVAVILNGNSEYGIAYECILLVAIILMGLVNAIEWKWQRVMISLVVQEK